MNGKFERKSFSQIDLNDNFFNSLKQDYPEFASSWFPKGIFQGREALVFYDSEGIGAFIATKEEEEPLQLSDRTLPACLRIKISTLRIAERFRGQRLGEGAIGLVLWEWQKSRLEEIYVTVFPSHDDLIVQLERFGFVNVGSNKRGERVYLRSRNHIDYSTPYKSFPFISPSFKKGGYLIVEDQYHDTLFPYSKLKNTLQEKLEKDVANGISKIYIGNQWKVHYQIGEPVFIYRKYNGATRKRYKSCLTSYCIFTGVVPVKKNGVQLLTFDAFCDEVGNKSVFSQEDLLKKYQQDKNLTITKLLYCGYFGSGNNVNMHWLDEHNIWTPDGGYPANTQLTPQQCSMIWQEGEIDISNILCL